MYRFFFTNIIIHDENANFIFRNIDEYDTSTMQVILGKKCMSKNNEVSNISNILT